MYLGAERRPKVRTNIGKCGKGSEKTTIIIIRPELEGAQPKRGHALEFSQLREVAAPYPPTRQLHVSFQRRRQATNERKVLNIHSGVSTKLKLTRRDCVENT